MMIIKYVQLILFIITQVLFKITQILFIVLKSIYSYMLKPIIEYLYFKKFYYLKIVNIKEFNNKNIEYFLIKDKDDIILYESKFVDSSNRNCERKKIIVKKPEIYVARIKNVNIFGASNIIKYDKIFGFFDMALSKECHRYDFRDGVIRYNYGRDSKQNIIEKGILLSGTASINYFHFLFEFIPKLSLIENLSLNEDYPLIIIKKILNIKQLFEILQYYSNNKDFVAIEEHKQYYVKDLIFPSLLTWMPLNVKKDEILKIGDIVIDKQVVDYLRKVINDLNPQYKKKRKKKIYLHRKNYNSHYRRLVNENDVVNFFIKEGYEIVSPELMTFKEQVKLFSSASHIAGPTGAAFSNIVFAPEKCKILCFQATKLQTDPWSIIANYLNQDVLLINGDVEILNKDMFLYQQDYFISIVKIKKALNILG